MNLIIFFAMQTELDDSNAVLPNFIEPEHRLTDITIDEGEVEDALKILNSSKASGPDLINPRLLKEGTSQLKYPIWKLFDLSLTSAIFPHKMEEGQCYFRILEW